MIIQGSLGQMQQQSERRCACAKSIEVARKDMFVTIFADAQVETLASRCSSPYLELETLEEEVEHICNFK